jgi:hypothetical protein
MVTEQDKYLEQLERELAQLNHDVEQAVINIQLGLCTWGDLQSLQLARQYKQSDIKMIKDDLQAIDYKNVTKESKKDRDFFRSLFCTREERQEVDKLLEE